MRFISPPLSRGETHFEQLAFLCYLEKPKSLDQNLSPPAAAIRRPGQSEFLENAFPTLPGGVAAIAVGLAAVGHFAGAHETVAGALVDRRLVGLVGSLHQLFQLGDLGVDAGI